MRNFLVFIGICTLLLIAMLLGTTSEDQALKRPGAQQQAKSEAVPYIGSIQVLNGCGMEGAANKAADFLRSKSFDVKAIGNAETWNYPFTMVVSRSENMETANQVAQALGTDKVVMIKNGERLYNVTVVLGPDYGDRIQ